MDLETDCAPDEGNVLHDPLPDWAGTLRPHQDQAVAEIMEAFESGTQFVFLDAPTGSGKTLIAELVRRRLGGKALYTCHTKSLQDQVLKDFSYARVIKGRVNYPTKLHPGLFKLPKEDSRRITCEDCTWDYRVMICRYCPTLWVDGKGVKDCPYSDAKLDAIGSPFAVLNHAYALAELNGPGAFVDRRLGIVDECDTLERALMGSAEVRITARRQEELGIGKPRIKTHTAKSAVEAWEEWLEATEEIVADRLKTLNTLLEALHPDNRQKQVIRERNRLSRLQAALENMYESLTDADGKALWIYDPGDTDHIIFKPVRVNYIAESRVWQHAEQWLLMSASIVSLEEMADSLGLSLADCALITVPSSFPKENRPIHVMPVTSMTAKTIEADYPKMADGVRKVLNMHPDERVLIHTHSYRLAKYLAQAIRRRKGRPIFTYGRAEDRDEALKKYKANDRSVLVAASMDRGIDLPHDLCRVMVVCKVPYPNLGDKQVNARLYSKGGRLWYDVQTVRDLVQMTGRGVRSADDWAITYILDEQFTNLKRSLYPAWWNEALKYHRWDNNPLRAA